MKKRNCCSIQHCKVKDIWNAHLVEGAQWTENENPVVKTTAFAAPTNVISYKDARTIYNSKIKQDPNFKIDAFIHFYINDEEFDGKTGGIWVKPDKLFKIASHFAGIIGPDFSIYADFASPLKSIQIYKMRTIEFACAKRNIPVIVNARFGSPITWNYTIDELPAKSMLAIGTVGSRLKYLENKYCFNQGLKRLIDVKKPHTLIVVGSSNYPCFEIARKRGVRIIQFDGDTCKHFKQKSKECYDKTR